MKEMNFCNGERIKNTKMMLIGKIIDAQYHWDGLYTVIYDGDDIPEVVSEKCLVSLEPGNNEVLYELEQIKKQLQAIEAKLS